MRRAVLRLSSRLLAPVTATVLSVGLITTTLPTIAEASQPAASSGTTYLGLEGEGDPVRALNDALRWELTQRGRDDGNTITLTELKLTMGCGDGDLACYAQGGSTLNSQELVFGTMTKSGTSWKVQLQTLDVATAKITNTIDRELTAAELSEAAVAQTAGSLLNELYKVTPTEADLPPPVVEDGPDEADPTGTSEPDEVVEEEPREGTLVWGPYQDRPKWKFIGLGVAGGLTLAAIGTAIGTTVAIGPNGPVRRDLIDAAEASMTDTITQADVNQFPDVYDESDIGQLKTSNDVNPNSNGDLCQIAQTSPDPNQPNAVKNAAVTKVCIKADNLATAATASWVATGVFAVTTIAFTVLLFVHKKTPAATAVRKHDIRLGGAPLRDGGFMMGGGLKF